MALTRRRPYPRGADADLGSVVDRWTPVSGHQIHNQSEALSESRKISCYENQRIGRGENGMGADHFNRSSFEFSKISASLNLSTEAII